MLYAEFAAQTLQQGLGEMLTTMSKTVNTHYSGNIISQMINGGILHVRKTPGSAEGIINIPLGLRFLDIKKLPSGKTKTAYVPVYNKYLWGYVYKYIIPTLRYGLTQAVETDIFNKLQKSYSQWENQ